MNRTSTGGYRFPTPDPGHVNCPNCGKANQSACTSPRPCANCTRCCVCRMCPQCSIHHPRRICGGCGLCKRWCHCRGKVKALHGRTQWGGGLALPVNPSPTTRSADGILHPKGSRLLRGMGLEVEMSYVPIQTFDWRFPFKFVRDGSLPEYGKELVIGPILSQDARSTLQQVYTDVQSAECRVDATCGLHVHVDGRDLDAYGYRRLLQLYIQLEHEFYGMVNPTRSGSKYCKPYPRPAILNLLTGMWGKDTDSSYIRRSLEGWMYKRTIPSTGDKAITDLKSQHYIDCRYYGMNLHSLLQRGSVEFRQMEGNFSLERSVGWANLCGWFVHLAANLRDEEVTEATTLEILLQGWKRPGYILGPPQEIVGEILGLRRKKTIVLPEKKRANPVVPQEEPVEELEVDYFIEDPPPTVPAPIPPPDAAEIQEETEFRRWAEAQARTQTRILRTATNLLHPYATLPQRQWTYPPTGFVFGPNPATQPTTPQPERNTNDDDQLF